jgi:sulfane dehydrogenase subunit SoxC
MANNHLEKAAKNGLIHRRHLLGFGLGAAGTLATNSVLGAEQGLQFEIPGWSKQPGPGASAYGKRSSYTEEIGRLAGAPNPLYPGGGSSRTPLDKLQGTITPNSLHFERHHAGIPDINPAGHKLVINGLVRQPLAFSYEDLLAYPMVSRIHFLECAGNSGTLNGSNPVNGSAQSIHGLVSCAEWTGIKLSTLLDEAGVLPQATWISAVGADAASMGRSVPLAKALDDVLIALYQNGEPIRPEQGYPMRLFVPGWEGNISVKWLTQLKVAEGPSQFRDETSKYSDTMADRRSLQFTFPMGTKSVITSPSGLMSLNRRGLYQVTGIAWSGSGAIRRVEVSADGGQSWANAMIDSHQSPKALTRFRIPWQWQGQEAVLLSRATDDKGNIQPSRQEHKARNGDYNRYHFNGTQSWSVDNNGAVRNVYV